MTVLHPFGIFYPHNGFYCVVFVGIVFGTSVSDKNVLYFPLKDAKQVRTKQKSVASRVIKGHGGRTRVSPPFLSFFFGSFRLILRRSLYRLQFLFKSLTWASCLASELLASCHSERLADGELF